MMEKNLSLSIDDMALISGQKPIITKFKKSISNFKTKRVQTQSKSYLKILQNVRVHR